MLVATLVSPLAGLDVAVKKIAEKAKEEAKSSLMESKIPAARYMP